MEFAADGDAGAEARAVLRGQSALFAEQIGLARNERFRNRIKAVRDIATGVAALILVAGMVLMVWDAKQASGLVIHPIATPPDLAERGLTSSAIASQLLDRLDRLQADTDSARAAGTYANNWEGDVSVEIPSTGISIDELSRWLRRELGRETQITGEVVRDGAALTMTVRAGGLGGKSVVEPGGDLDALLQASAEAIYEASQPYRYATYLLGQNRLDERRAVLSRLSKDGVTLDRAWALMGIGLDQVATGDLSGATVSYRQAIRLQPDLGLAWRNLATAERALGHDEQSLVADRTASRLWRGRAARHVDAGVAVFALALNEASLARLVGDNTRAAAILGRAADLPDWSDNQVSVPLQRAEALAGNYEFTAARLLLGSQGEGDAEWIDVSRPGYRVEAPVPSLLIAHSGQRWGELEQLASARDAAMGASAGLRVSRVTLVRPLWAEALARLGRRDEAESLLSTLPNDWVPCLRSRGRIAAFDGDRASTDRWFAMAVRQAPSSPFAYAEWGLARLARGEQDAAVVLFRDAHNKGPRWANPLKYWGDALLAQGDERGAIRKYQEAANRAPRWGGLHLAWGRALEAQGRHDQAHEKYAEAAGMDLSAADRAEVARRLEAAGKSG